MAVNNIVEVLGIKTEADFKSAVGEFERTIASTLKPLTDKLQQQVLSPEVQQLELHMTFVESWRDRTAKALMIANSFVNHGRSHHFLLPGGKNITTTDREAYQKGIVGSCSSVASYLEDLIKSIDSRVNLCKILLRNEVESNTNRRY
jgi:hypothetical protein